MATFTNARGATILLLIGAITACAGDPVGLAPREAASLQAEEVISIQTGWSGFAEPARVVLTDDEQWAAAWETLYQYQSPVPERPAVDFRSSVLVLVAMGTRPTTGYSVKVESVQHHAGVLYVAVRERSPGASCGTGQALTAPVHIVQVPREGATARFHVTRHTYSC